MKHIHPPARKGAALRIMRALIISRGAILEELQQLKQGIRQIMTVLDDVQASQATTDTLIAKLAADIVAKIAAISLLGMTPEQQAQLTDVAAHANKINDALSGVDATVAADPAPAPTA